HPLASRHQDGPYSQHLYSPDKDVRMDARFQWSSPASPTFGGADSQHLVHEAADSFFQLASPELISSPASTVSPPDSISGRVLPHARRLTSPVLMAQVNVFLKYLFPIMPVVRKEQLQLDSHHPQRLSPQRYSFMASLCAATHIQLNL